MKVAGPPASRALIRLLQGAIYSAPCVERGPCPIATCSFRGGEQANELFVIKSGYVRIQVGNKTMADLAPDTIFGEMALIDNEPRSATATALTDVELVPVSEKQFLFLVSQTPHFALKVMRTLAQRLRTMNKGVY